MSTTVTVPDVLADYVTVIETAMTQHPRSLQTRIGPSEIGMDCTRRLIHKLAGDPEPEDGRVPWKPEIGTAVHEHLERVFQAANEAEDPMIRWLTESEVTVGTIGGTPITGHCDLFDTFTCTVLDHKIVGNSTLSKYRTHGPSRQYRSQAHLYGRGWEHAGQAVQQVAICFLPREAEWSKKYLWSEPYDPQVAEAALARANDLYQLVQLLGADGAATLYPPCDSPFCPWCRTSTNRQDPMFDIPSTHHH